MPRMSVFDARLQQQLRTANIGRSVQARHDILAKSPIESSRAAAHAIREGELEHAIELLEHGRSVVWQQTLRLRPSTDKLHQVSPALAGRLSKTLGELDGMNVEPLAPGVRPSDWRRRQTRRVQRHPPSSSSSWTLSMPSGPTTLR
ncbi:hypothetical protein HETIRDRAFT_412081 [Heterobasidion irregulare TC 32-1]|uniref:Uncharacterized protein n=1 Tax=Heterobasidion irregulare (strain TC 32-1) TaxID=747525 RepID=W4JQ23_HETIT|nr:uncharacterized protein HETIRDRAFT_412081 [Heterobasidion irregulare TC 32-1]ETW75633.1 hypothetical protein HETIRDRAFT_412081 [Heterobasidion irregulare TC 32-1]